MRVSSQSKWEATSKDVLRKLHLFDFAKGVYLRGNDLVFRPKTVALRAGAVLRGMPLPPAELIFLVAGQSDATWFSRIGRLGFECVKAAMDRTIAPSDRPTKILDFGCGCGRVLRYWRAVKGVDVSGTDYNPRLIQWCQAHLRFGRFKVNGLSPPLPYADDEFDFIYVLSVFTHLTEDIQFLWMAELRRVLRAGGVLLITTHGDHYTNILTPIERAEYDRGTIVVRLSTHAGQNQCATFHPPGYVRQTMAEGFEVLEFKPEGALGNPSQDMWLLRKT